MPVENTSRDLRPIFIVGYMGSGKSTIGRLLAELLGYHFVDTDFFIENRFRERVMDMFASVGEEVFRRREHVVIEELAGMEQVVIATGGGLPCFFGNMDLLLDSGRVIYLSASDEVLAHRLELCKRTRPMVKDISGLELLEHVRATMLLRRPIYCRAHYEWSVDELKDKTDERRLAEAIALVFANND